MTVPVFLTDGNGSQVYYIDGGLPITNVPGTPLVTVANPDAGAQDAFGRSRVSSPTTLLDSKSVNNEDTLVWDNAETSGSGTTSVYSANRSDVQLITTTGTAGVRVRQTFRHFNYHTAKSQLIFMTAASMGTSTGMTKRMGYFHEKDGLFFQSDAGVLSFVTRSYTSGSAVDTGITQANWNLDKLDGTGKSGYTLDPDKGNILIIDFEWLGVGRARFGFVIDGKIIYCHAINNANNITAVYMRSPNLPARYEIANDGNGVADLFMYSICASISTEGVQAQTGSPHGYGPDVTNTLTGTTNTWAMTGLRLRADHLDADVIFTNMQGFATTTDGVLVTVHVNPTINGTVSWANVADAAVQGFTGNGATLNITDPGHIVYKFAYYGKETGFNVSGADTPLLGSYIDGTPTTVVMGMKALTSNPKAMGFINWREV